MIDDFNMHLIHHNMKIIGAEEFQRNIYYKIDIGNKGFAIVDYKYNDFALSYGSLAFGEEALEDISIDNIFKNSKIRSEKTITTIIDSIGNIIAKRNFDLEDVNTQFNELIIRNCKNDRYIILNLKETIEKFKELAILNSKKLDREVVNYVLSCKNTKGKNEMDSYRRKTNI